MKHLHHTHQIALSLLGASLVILSGCTRDPNANHPPEITIKTDQFINKGDTVHLKAKVHDADKEEQLTYLWRLTSRPKGSNVSITNKTTTHTTFTTDKSGTYQLDFSADDTFATSRKIITIVASSIEGEWKVDLAKSKKENTLKSEQTTDLIEVLSSNYKIAFLENGKVEGDDDSSWGYNKDRLYYIKNKEGEKKEVTMVKPNQISLTKKLSDGTEVTAYYNRMN